MNVSVDPGLPYKSRAIEPGMNVGGWYMYMTDVCMGGCRRFVVFYGGFLPVYFQRKHTSRLSSNPTIPLNQIAYLNPILNYASSCTKQAHTINNQSTPQFGPRRASAFHPPNNYKTPTSSPSHLTTSPHQTPSNTKEPKKTKTKWPPPTASTR